jgi:hypothetical protein
MRHKVLGCPGAFVGALLAICAFGAHGVAADASCGTSLPDCRTYELVSPPFKFGQPAITPKGIAADGDRIAFNSLGAFGEPGNDSEQLGGAYIGERGSSGWLSSAVNPSATEFQGGNPNLQTGEADETVDFSSDLGSSLFLQARTGTKPIDSRFFRRELSGALTEIGPVIPPNAVAEWDQADAELDQVPAPGYRGATSDFSRVLFEDRASGGEPVRWLWPGDETAAIGKPSLYEYAGTNQSEPELVGVENETSLARAAHEQGKAHINETASLISQCGVAFGGPEPATAGRAVEAYNALSESGETVVFTALGHETGECRGELRAPEKNEVYARIGREQTVPISEPTTGPGGACAPCNDSEPQNAFFAGASRDGTRVFFISEQALLPGAAGSNLYEYDFNGPEAQKVSLVADELPKGEGESQLEGVVRVAESGRAVYFVSTAVLAANTNEVGDTAVEGSDNMYLYGLNPEDGSPETTFIATLSAESDQPDWKGPDSRPVEATPDGRFLLFPSTASLTADSSGDSRQLYRYEAPSMAHRRGQLVRISTGNDGYNMDGNAAAEPASLFSPRYRPALDELGAESDDFAATMPVLISDDGTKVFFESPLALTPSALNNACAYEAFGTCEAPALNVYEWEEGSVHLLSDGLDSHSRFRFSATDLIGATPSGGDVFFTTADQLVPQDTDTQVDIYDARENGGFVAPRTPFVCSGETCQGVPTAAPPFAAPATTTVAGIGNESAPAVPVVAPAAKKATAKCKVGRRLRKGKCVEVKFCARRKRDRARARQCVAPRKSAKSSTRRLRPNDVSDARDQVDRGKK